MEKTLLVNDFLFVSKSAYGPRIPNTPIAMPFVHHTMPWVNAKSYSEWIKIPYTRWFSKEVTRNDAVVFNFPANDTLINDEENFGSKITYFEAGSGVVKMREVKHVFARLGISGQIVPLNAPTAMPAAFPAGALPPGALPPGPIGLPPGAIIPPQNNSSGPILPGV